jgi:hypothetical protein
MSNNETKSESNYRQFGPNFVENKKVIVPVAKDLLRDLTRFLKQELYRFEKKT